MSRNLDHGPVASLCEGRHPSVGTAARWLDVNPALEGPQRQVAQLFVVAALGLLESVPDGPELVQSLWRLGEAKNLAVQASLAGTAWPNRL